MFRSLSDPHFAFSSILDGIDLSMVHFTACLVGALMALYVGRLWRNGMTPVLVPTCWFARLIGTAALCVLALSMLWSLAYSTTKGWQPWPPDLFVLLAIDLFMLATIVLAEKARQAERQVA